MWLDSSSMSWNDSLSRPLLAVEEQEGGGWGLGVGGGAQQVSTGPPAGGGCTWRAAPAACPLHRPLHPAR
jgi:hypothetical protein